MFDNSQWDNKNENNNIFKKLMINHIMLIVQPAVSLSTEIIKIQYNAHGRKETTQEKTLA